MKLYVAILVAALSVPAAASADYLGKVTAVVDGDTFTMEAETRRIRVRICGIDAPERGQPGYDQAAGVLVEHDRRKARPLPAGRPRHAM